MVEGQVVLVVAYSGRNPSDKAPHRPETGQDFNQAYDVTKKKLDPFEPKGYVALDRVEDKAQAILRAPVLYFAGGNTAGHVANLMGLKNYDGSPIDNVRGANTKPLQYAIRSAVAAGIPYIGVSAGEMITAAHTFLHLDPPAHVQIQKNIWGETSYVLNNTGLNLLGNSNLGIEPHAALHQDTNYLDETRYDRLHQVVERMHWIQALLTRNQSALVVKGNRMALVGDATSGGHLLTFNGMTGRVQKIDIPVGADLSYLLDTDLRKTHSTRR
jgi:peptidase E